MQVIAIIGIFNVLYTKAVLICSTLVVYHVELPDKENGGQTFLKSR